MTKDGTPVIGHRVQVAAFALLVSLSCARARYVSIPEAQFRTEVSREERIALPLSEADEERLRAFLSAGGNTDSIGNTTPDPDLWHRYDPLLVRLRQKLTRDELLEQRVLNAWLGKEILRQVVDAREARPPAIQPIALADDRFWWVFYVKAGNANALMVVRRLGQKPKE